MSRDLPWPKAPSRQDILDMVGDKGMDKWRNPVHLRAVTGEWPKPQTEEARGEKRLMEMEMTPSHRNGSLPK